MTRWREIGLLLRLDLALLLKERIVLVCLVLLPLLSAPMALGGQALIDGLDLEEKSEEIVTVKGPESLRPFVETAPGLRWADDADAELQVSEQRLTIQHKDSADGKKARARLREVAARWEQEQTRLRWAEAGLPMAPEALVQVEKVDHARSSGMLGAILAQAILFFALLSGLYIATDLIAGERERGTMETLLSTPPSRRSLLTAKFLGLCVVVQAVAALVLASAALSAAAGWLSPGPPDAGSWLLALLASAPLSVLLAAALLVAGALIPDFRSGQAVALPLMLGGMLLAMVAMLPNFILTFGTALIPISGVSLLLRDVLSGPVDGALFAWTFAVSGAQAAAVVAIASRAVSREGLLLGARAGRDRHARGEFGREVAVAYLLLIGLIFALGLPAQVADIAWGMVVTQIGVFGLFAVGFLVVLGQPLRPTLGLGRPSARDLGLGLLLGGTMSGPAVLVDRAQQGLIPTPGGYAEQFARALTPDLPLWATIFLFAFLPGVCEELVFRGAFHGLLQRSMKPWALAVVVGGLFGLIHIDPPRILPVTAIGILLGLARQRSGSLWVPVVAHTLNNAILMTALVRGGALPEPPVAALLGMAALSALALLGMRGQARISALS